MLAKNQGTLSLGDDPELLVESYRQEPTSQNMGRIMVCLEPMVRNLARKFASGKRNRIVSQADLVSAGNVGLANAAQKHDPARGPFKSYAYMMVRFSIVDELRRYGVSGYKFHQGVRREALEEETLLSTDSFSIADLDFAEILGQCRASLTDQQVCVVVCYYAEGMALGKIGKLMGMGQWRVSELHQSALDAIASCLNAA